MAGLPGQELDEVKSSLEQVAACHCVDGRVSCNKLDTSDGASCTMVPEGTRVFNTCPCANGIGNCDGSSICKSGVWRCTPDDRYRDAGS